MLADTFLKLYLSKALRNNSQSMEVGKKRKTFYTEGTGYTKNHRKERKYIR
jgi:hypothetical protein